MLKCSVLPKKGWSKIDLILVLAPFYSVLVILKVEVKVAEK